MNLPWMRDYNAAIAQELMEYEKLEVAVKQLTGYDFRCLYELFRMGWSIEPPKNASSLPARFSEIFKEFEMKGY